jgi:hypothetical protein
VLGHESLSLYRRNAWLDEEPLDVDRESRKKREPRAEPNGNRDDLQGPTWQIVHGAMSPTSH